MTQRRYLASPYRWDEAWVDYVPIASPAAGATASLPIPGDYGVTVLAARATLSTDANAANRLVSLDFVNANGVTMIRNAPSVVWPANTSNQAFIWNCAWAVSEWNSSTPVMVPVNDLCIPSGWTIKFAVDSIQVGDTLTGLSLTVLKVPTGAADSY